MLQLIFLRVTYVVDCFACIAADVGVGIWLRRRRQPDPSSLGRSSRGFDRQLASGSQSSLADGAITLIASTFSRCASA